MRGSWILTIFMFKVVLILGETLKIYSDEVAIIALSPRNFNWTTTEEVITANYTYAASLSGLPDLPKWIQLTHSPQMKMGFLFGTPPAVTETVKLDIVATNQDTFETNTIEFALDISLKADIPRRQIKMKIHNANIEDMMIPAKQSTLLNIFRSVLWPESALDLHFMELNSALSVGGRRPARREDGEGVILTLGSRAEFSEALRDLEREISPLWSFRPCPRDFKKTSVERYFRSKGFFVDWCSFRLIPENPVLVTASPTADMGSKTEHPVVYKSNKVVSEETGLWRSPARWELPKRNYTEDGLMAVFVPLVILLLLTGLLTAVVGVHPEGKETQEGQLYEGVFEEMPCLKNRMEPTDRKALGSLKTSLNAPVNRDSATPSINRLKMNTPFDIQLESTRGSSPFVMVSTSPSQTPGSTLSRSAVHTPYSAITYSDRTSTLGRREPPPYVGALK